MRKDQTTCPNCRHTGAVQTHSGHVVTCPKCGGTGAVNRRTVSPFDYVVPFTIPAAGTITVSVTILDYDFKAKWIVGDATSPDTDTVQVRDNTQLYWSNSPVAIANFAGTGQLPFPFQPNPTFTKNIVLIFTFAGAEGDTGEIVLRGSNLADDAE